MYSIAASIEALSKQSTGLQDVMTGLNKSKFWTIISRSASGILPNFWALQNKLRAVTDAFVMYYDGQSKGNKSMMESINAQVQLSEALENLNTDLIDGSMDLETWSETARRTVKEYGAITQASEKYVEALEKEGKITFADDLERQAEILKDAQKTTKAMLESQQGKLTEAQDRVTQSRLDQDEIDAAKDNPVAQFFIKQRQRLNAFAKAIGPVLKGLMQFLKSFFLWSTVFLLGLLVIVNIFKLLWPHFQESRKLILASLKLIFTGIVSILGGIIGMVVAALQGDFGKFGASFLKVIGGLLQILIGVFMVGIGLVTAVIESAVNFMFGKLADGEKVSQRIGEVVFGILSAVLVVMAAITFIATGGWLVALGYLLAAAVSGAIANAVRGRATGGVVSENMTLVGERGPELVSLPRGSRVHTNNESKSMTGTTNITVNVQGRIGASDAEVKDMANKVAREINLRMNRTNTTQTRFA